MHVHSSQASSDFQGRRAAKAPPIHRLTDHRANDDEDKEKRKKKKKKKREKRMNRKERGKGPSSILLLQCPYQQELITLVWELLVHSYLTGLKTIKWIPSGLESF